MPSLDKQNMHCKKDSDPDSFPTILNDQHGVLRVISDSVLCYRDSQCNTVTVGSSQLDYS